MYCILCIVVNMTFSRWQILPAEPVSIIAHRFIRVEGNIQITKIEEILKVYIINSISITKSYILNIKIRPLVTEYALMIKLVGGRSSGDKIYN